MQGGKAIALEQLRQQVSALETGPALRTAESAGRLVRPGLLATPRGTLHEVFADQGRDGGAALGFALAQAGRLLEPARPVVLFLQLVADAQELGLPYGLGFGQFGIAPDRLVLTRTESLTELLWAVEEAIACRAVAGVVADIAHPHKALDFTASRRLSLRAAASGASVILVRYAKEREASAAKFRWRVSPAPSQPPPFDLRAPGPPRWRVQLEKGSLGKGRKTSPEGEEYLVDWCDNEFVRAERSSGGGSLSREVAALPAAPPAVLGDRLSQAS